MFDRMRNNLFFLMYVLINPHLVYLAIFKGIYIPVYVQYGWVKDFDINTIVDVGAHRGNVFSSLMYMFPRAKVYAFEPDEENFRYLDKKYNSNKNIELNKYAVSNKDGKSTFYTHPKSYMSSLLEPGNDRDKNHLLKEQTRKVTVDTITLDSYFKDKEVTGNVFLKVDTQGSEGLVLRGAKHFLKRVKVVHVEAPFDDLYKGQDNFAQIYKLLTELGFKYAGEARESYFYTKFNLEISSNCVFIRTHHQA